MHLIEKECDPLLHPSGETFSIGKHCLYSTRIEGGKYWFNDGNLRAFLKNTGIICRFKSN